MSDQHVALYQSEHGIFEHWTGFKPYVRLEIWSSWPRVRCDLSARAGHLRALEAFFKPCEQLGIPSSYLKLYVAMFQLEHRNYEHRAFFILSVGLLKNSEKPHRAQIIRCDVSVGAASTKSMSTGLSPKLSSYLQDNINVVNRATARAQT